MEEVIYELKQPIQYSSKGEKVEATFVTMFGPTYKQMGSFTAIKQAFMASVKEIKSDHGTPEPAETGNDEVESEIMEYENVMLLLYQRSEPISKVFLHAEKLFKDGGAMIEGETSFTDPLIKSLSLPDFEGLLGTYIANFIAPSLMDGL